MPYKRLQKTRESYKKWVVAWIHNGISRAEEFDTKELAMAKMIQLEAFQMEPSLHERQDNGNIKWGRL
jgi:hypothetical protein